MKKLRTLDNQPRHRISRIPLEDSAGALCDPKLKLTGSLRRALFRSRAIVVDFPRSAPVAEAVKDIRRFGQLSLAQLFRRRHQSARRASTAKHILDDLSPSSKFRQPVAWEQDRQLAKFSAVNSEVDRRQYPITFAAGA